MNTSSLELIPGLPDDVARECLIRVPYASSSAAAAACEQWKDEIKSREFWSLRRSKGHSQFVLVVAQARPGPAHSLGSPKLTHAPSYRLTAFDPVLGNWWELPPLPGCSDGIPMFCQLAAAGSDLVVVGGLDPVTWEASRSVYVYSFIYGGWRQGAEMPTVCRSFFACASDGQGMVFLAGGHDGEKNALRSAAAYDVAADRWLTMPDMAEERDECKGMFSHDRFLVLGGYPTESQGGFVKSAEEFDVATWRWTAVRDDPTTCVEGVSDDALYMCRDGNMLGADASSHTIWGVLGRLPADVGCPAQVTTWRGRGRVMVMVIGSARFGEPPMGYLLEVNTNNSSNSKNNNNNWSAQIIENVDDRFSKKCTWSRMEFEEKFSGHVQSVCLMEI